MSDLESSTKRLDAAMARLEAIVEKRGRNNGAADGKNARLEVELARLRTDFNHLRETSSGVSVRLDGAIGKLKAVLEDDS